MTSETTTTSNPVATGARNVTLENLAAMLRDQHARTVDIVTPASAIRASSGQLVIDSTDPVLGPDGVTMTSGTYTPTTVCDQGLADKLGIPAQYLRKLREQRPALFDANVNGWLAGDPRKFLVRCLRPAAGPGPGAARAFLSDGYKRIDNLDVLLAALDGIRAAGAPVQIDGCDLTDRRMYVRVVCEQVRTLAPALLADYRSPYTGASGADNPVVFAGFVISNSETGCGAFTLTPRLVVEICNNGLTMTKDAIRAVHLGERLDEGVVTWSGNTLDKTLALITAKTTDAVATFLNPRYAEQALRAITARAGHPLPDPQHAVEVVSQRLRFTDTQQASILNCFIRGGDLTAGGILHAVTSAAQAQPDADTAHDMEAAGLRALEIAATL
ncbi:MAG TPA: DUF932 domain-containing protein [Streptosporangiaceae bacterium]|nr:DUF932 domain-containing protein [Streptosporangiaceae bacterium]